MASLGLNTHPWSCHIISHVSSRCMVCAYVCLCRKSLPKAALKHRLGLLPISFSRSCCQGAHCNGVKGTRSCIYLQDTSKMVWLLFMFYNWENWGQKRLSTLLKVIDLVGGRAGIRSQSYWTSLGHDLFFTSEFFRDESGQRWNLT